MNQLTRYEKETILLTSEGDSTWDIYTFNPALKRRLAAFAENYPECCRLKSTTKEGAATYVLEKARLSLRLLPPLSEEKKKARSRAAKELGLGVSIGKYAE